MTEFDALTIKGHDLEIEVRAFVTKATAVTYLTQAICTDLNVAINTHGQAHWAGAGGTTPKPVYEALSHIDVDWGKVSLSLVDERHVGLEDEASNEAMIRISMTQAIFKGMSVYGLYLDEDLTTSAHMANLCLQNLGSRPLFDVVLLGMGTDAHYASIFANHSINAGLYESKSLILPVEATQTQVQPKISRLTMTPNALNQAPVIRLYITGTQKLDVLKAALAKPEAMRHPIGAFIHQYPGAFEIVWAP
jgi:6-phosphogluconolactonase